MESVPEVVRSQPNFTMSHTNESIHGSRRLRRALGLSLSGVALVGLIYFEGMSARAAVEELDDDAIEALDDEDLDTVEALDDAAQTPNNAVSGPAPTPMPPPERRVAPASATPADGRLAMAATTTIDTATAMPSAPALVAVPNIAGLSLRKAKKELAAVGLKLSVRDEYGEKVPREYWSGYKVRKQKLEAGTEVAPGSTVKVKARMRADYLMGY